MQQAPIVVALGGNALKAGESFMDYPALAPACAAMAGVAGDGLVVTHGNGPQIGMLAGDMTPFMRRGLDALGAETEGLLGYLIEQELANHLPEGRRVSTLLTRMEVAADDPAFGEPTKPIGPWLSAQEKEELARGSEWVFTEKDGRFRRLVPSPQPLRFLQLDSVRTLLAAATAVICSGGGGIPVVRNSDGRMEGVEAVIDKDRASARLGAELHARLLVLATDVDGVYLGWDSDTPEKIETASPAELEGLDLPAGSMGPKVEAAAEFVAATGATAIIGALGELSGLLAGRGGTRIEPDVAFRVAGEGES